MKIKKILRENRFSPSKRRGQVFLVNKGILKKIVETANLGKKDFVLEIGAGLGNLTFELAKKAGLVLAVEKEKKLAEILENNLKSFCFQNVMVFPGDILKNFQKIVSFLPKNYKVVANIPYYLSSRLIRKFLEEKKKPQFLVLMLQKELAQRICASPPKMSLLAVSVQFYAKSQIISFVSRNSFFPIPKVDSAILKIVPKRNLKVSQQFRANFFKILRAGFSHPRKQLVNNFSKELKVEKKKIIAWLLKCNLFPNQRAEELKVEDWIKLALNFKV